MNKHTPGPWQVSWNTFKDGEAHGIYADGEMDLKGFQIAVVEPLPTIQKGVNEEEGKANAMLIASAPEMLEEIQFAYRYFSKFGFNWEGRDTAEGQFVLSSMRSIIAKATGKKESGE